MGVPRSSMYPRSLSNIIRLSGLSSISYSRCMFSDFVLCDPPLPAPPPPPPPETGLEAFLGQFGEAMLSLKFDPDSGPPPADPDPMLPPGDGAELWGLPGGGPAPTGTPAVADHQPRRPRVGGVVPGASEHLRLA